MITVVQTSAYHRIIERGVNPFSPSVVHQLHASPCAERRRTKDEGDWERPIKWHEEKNVIGRDYLVSRGTTRFIMEAKGLGNL